VRFLALHTYLWLITVWFSAATFVVKFATFAKPEFLLARRTKTSKRQNQEMQKLIEYLKNVIQLADNDFMLLESKCTEIEFEKGQILLREGEIAKNLYFLEKGLLSGKCNRNGKEVINWFAYENQFVTSMYSFVSQKPSYESIEALEYGLAYGITFEKLQSLYKQISGFEKLGRILTEQYYIKLEERTLSLQYLSASDRYKQFLEQEPELYQRISLGQLSSYLGISQETLSRVRAKK
jgi:CRP-like cAMP-binding protein